METERIPEDALRQQLSAGICRYFCQISTQIECMIKSISVRANPSDDYYDNYQAPRVQQGPGAKPPLDENSYILESAAGRICDSTDET